MRTKYNDIHENARMKLTALYVLKIRLFLKVSRDLERGLSS